ncbi:hypothetical protein NX801_15995 [Streptomyces sp. LP05-1]|uniref:Secreted protein n=1 Tax=Streptomyces pyxinae TaxID=2970734 RepID=A0ABT2CI94_9ACTN|nr:hypothetical protein [Streptomyces sp. LP05-1]MCS0637135.1 hypothetical protein [Streptomyces sp. LP05-1]
MARSSSGIVAGLTAAAVAAVAFLAYQASATAPAHLTDRGGATGAKPSATAPAPSGAGKPSPDPSAPPAHSGSGKRVVYALGARTVWLVDAKDAKGADGGKGTEETTVRTFRVVPSTISPPPGAYSVTSRSNSVAGSDGVRIEHVVRFATVSGVTIGFSAAVDGSLPSPDPSRKTGGVRMQRADGDALWKFASVHAKVVVIP